MHNTPIVDCEEGRRLGCQTFCCRLLVRLDPDEQEPATVSQMPKRFVDKDAQGYCVNLDRETHRCRVWARRPRACREYDCNSDFLLQVALRRRFANIVELVTAAGKEYIPKESYITVPHRNS
jgi:Fe-S-cluster containining protein